jgi:spore germination cell wall hydrolase CwlJ-like protein
MTFKSRSTNFPYLKLIHGFLIGALASTSIAMAMPTEKPVVDIVKVPEVKIIEKPVEIKQPEPISAHDKRQIQCLAQNAYFEAGNQSKKGMIAVTNVVMNRANDKRFPSTPCAVIYQKARGVCQFSWVCEGKKNIRDWTLFEKTKNVAEHVYLGNYGDVTHGAKFYHANYVNPNWGMKRVTQIGAHIFYRG